MGVHFRKGVFVAADNDVIIKAWNTVLFDKFLRFKHLLVDSLALHSKVALDRRNYDRGSRVVDIGCAFGDSTRMIAERVGPTGEAVGVDCASRFIDAARSETSDEKVANASYFVADVQTGDLRGPYDSAFSRFGTMFFTSPGAALRNMRKALRPGGDLTMIVWRRREENPWVYEAELRVKEILPPVSHEDTDEVHCGPGPFSMAGADMVSTMLRGAGFERIAFERFDADICIGRDLGEAIEFAMALGPAGEIIRLAGDEGIRRKPDVIAALRDALSQFERSDGVWAPSSAWFVTSRHAA
jgi:ubiquinone/menaquinone biosynthesis C-methylase UbiE